MAEDAYASKVEARAQQLYARQKEADLSWVRTAMARFRTASSTGQRYVPPVLPEGDDALLRDINLFLQHTSRDLAPIQAEVAAILAWTEHVTHLPDIIAAGRRDGVTARRGSSLDEFAQLTTMPDGPAAPLVRALQTAIANYVRTVIAEELRHVDLIADAETKFAHGDHSQRVSAAVIQGPWGKAAVSTNYLLERMAARDPR